MKSLSGKTESARLSSAEEKSCSSSAILLSFWKPAQVEFKLRSSNNLLYYNTIFLKS